MKTKLLTLLLCLLTTLPVLAIQIDGIYYNITGDNTVEVTHSGGNGLYRGSITIPAEVQYYGKTFSVTTIGQSAFYGCMDLDEVIIPNSVTEIGNEAFYNCLNLPWIAIPNTVTSIGKYAFYNCESLPWVAIPTSMTSINEGTFCGCKSLTSVTIPNSVTKIGNSTFSGCKSLASVTIPNSVTQIDGWAFGNCTSLKKIYCEAKVPPTCDDETFANVSLSDCTLYVPAEAINLYRYTAYKSWGKFGNIVGVESKPEEPSWPTAVTIEAESKHALFVPYVWASSDETVASVSQTGEITAVAPGTCTVTLTWGDLVYSCVVTVGNKAGVAEVSSVSPAVVYDLQGRRVSNPHRGIFIVNGQKQRLN